MPTVEQMMEKYKDLMETSKSCYINGHDDLHDYIERIDAHYEYIRGYLNAIYVFGFMRGEEFDKLTDEIFKIRTTYQYIAFERYKEESPYSEQYEESDDENY